MPEQLREPFARRGETWDRAEVAATTAAAATHDEHPEMLALIRVQHREMTALVAAHSAERVRLALQLRDESTTTTT